LPDENSEASDSEEENIPLGKKNDNRNRKCAMENEDYDTDSGASKLAARDLDNKRSLRSRHHSVDGNELVIIDGSLSDG
jgi:hypothetical protein